MANKWSPVHKAHALNAELSHKQVSELTGYPEHAVRAMRQRLQVAPAIVATSVEDDVKKYRADYWRQQFNALQKKYERVLSDGSATAQLVEMAESLAPRSYSPMPSVTRVGQGKGSAQTAVLLLSDTHIGQVVTPEQTLGYGGYNFPTFLARLKFLEAGVISILRDHTTTRVDELVLCIGGDMIHGALNHGAEAAQHNTLFTQFYAGGHALAQFIRNLAPHVPYIRIEATPGNHPRWGNQHKMPTDNRFSNLDTFLSAYVKALTADLKTVDWNLTTQPFSLFTVYNFLFCLAHGDILRGGDKALGVPNHSVARMINSMSQLKGKLQEASPNYFLTGHLHREISLPHARGSFIVNGGFPGIDSYGLAGGFSPVDPSQTFFFVHPKFGKTAHYNLQLKFAKVDEKPPYEIPKDFPCV